MSAKKFSAAAGFLLLICSVVGIFIVIYGTETYSTSSASTSTAGRRVEVEESLTLIHDRSISKTHPKTVNGSKIGTNKNDLKMQQTPSSTNGPGNHNQNHRNMNKKDSFKPGSSKDSIKIAVTNPNPNTNLNTNTNTNININSHPKTDMNMPPVRTTVKPRKPHERNGISSSHSNININSKSNSNEAGHGAHSMEKPKVLGMRIDTSKVNSNSKFQLPSPAQSIETMRPMPMTVTMPMPMSKPNPKPTTTLKTGQRNEQMNWNEFSPSPWSPLMEPNVNLRVPLNQRILSPGESLVTTNTNNPRPPHSQSHLSKSGPGSSPSPPHLNSYNSLELTSQEVQSGEEQYNSDLDSDLEWEEEEDEQEGGGGGEKDEFHVGQLFDLATHLYESGTNASDIQEFLRVINETVNKGNNSDLLTKLNELYSRPESKSEADAESESELDLQDASSLKKSKSTSPTAVAMGRNTMETSLTAFVFMSFGVFLLNQIHSFIGKDKTKGQGLRSQQARSFLGFGGGGGNYNSLMDEPEQSNLEILFNSPPGFDSNVNSSWTKGWYEIALEKTKHNNNNNNSSSNKDKEEDGYWKERNETEIGIQSNSKKNLITSSPSSSLSSSSSSSPSSGYVNNMFRALLNLVNAYTRNTQVLECIWSLYCQDLDRTSNNTGLYGIAARINSIGLRLIMDQIPAELTMDVLLRSMLGWDGLPCAKMFNKCKPEAAASTLLSATSDKKP